MAERGIPPLTSLAVSDDCVIAGEAIRALANLAVNPEAQAALLAEGVLIPMVAALKSDDENCQRCAPAMPHS